MAVMEDSLSSQPHNLHFRKYTDLIQNNTAYLWYTSCSKSSIKNKEWNCKDPELLSMTQITIKSTISRTRAKFEIAHCPSHCKFIKPSGFYFLKARFFFFHTKTISTQICKKQDLSISKITGACLYMLLYMLLL